MFESHTIDKSFVDIKNGKTSTILFQTISMTLNDLNGHQRLYMFSIVQTPTEAIIQHNRDLMDRPAVSLIPRPRFLDLAKTQDVKQPSDGTRSGGR